MVLNAIENETGLGGKAEVNDVVGWLRELCAAKTMLTSSDTVGHTSVAHRQEDRLGSKAFRVSSLNDAVRRLQTSWP